MIKHKTALFLMYIFAYINPLQGITIHYKDLSEPLVHSLIKELRKIQTQRSSLHTIPFSFAAYKNRTEYIIDLIKRALALGKNEFEIVMNEETLSDVMSTFIENKRHAADFSALQKELLDSIRSCAHVKEYKAYLETLVNT